MFNHSQSDVLGIPCCVNFSGRKRSQFIKMTNCTSVCSRSLRKPCNSFLCKQFLRKTRHGRGCIWHTWQVCHRTITTFPVISVSLGSIWEVNCWQSLLLFLVWLQLCVCCVTYSQRSGLLCRAPAALVWCCVEVTVLWSERLCDTSSHCSRPLRSVCCVFVCEPRSFNRKVIGASAKPWHTLTITTHFTVPNPEMMVHSGV